MSYKNLTHERNRVIRDIKNMCNAIKTEKALFELANLQKVQTKQMKREMDSQVEALVSCKVFPDLTNAELGWYLLLSNQDESSDKQDIVDAAQAVNCSTLWECVSARCSFYISFGIFKGVVKPVFVIITQEEPSLPHHLRMSKECAIKYIVGMSENFIDVDDDEEPFLYVIGDEDMDTKTLLGKNMQRSPKRRGTAPSLGQKGIRWMQKGDSM